MDIGGLKDNLSPLLHSVDLDTLDSLPLALERAANTMLSKIDPLDTIRIAALSNVIHDDVYNYSLPSDFKDIIDLYPQDNRESNDTARRRFNEIFDLQKEITQKNIATESSEGSKYIRVNWRSRGGKVINTMDSATGNGTWSAVGSATGVRANTIFKVSGSASIEFDLVATGDGIQNTTMTAVDLTDEDEVADFFVWMYFSTVPTSVSAVWGNNLTTAYWTSIAQTTQSDGTAFKVGWNLIKFSWASATETGTVDPATIDSFKITVAKSTALTNIRVDNIICSIGRNFDIKYYSKYLLKNTSGTWLTKTTDDTDIVVLDNDAIQIYLLESLLAVNQQIGGTNDDFTWARLQLNGDPQSADPAERIGLYGQYRKRYPTQAKKAVTSYGGLPRFRR